MPHIAHREEKAKQGISCSPGSTKYHKRSTGGKENGFKKRGNPAVREPAE